LLQVRVWAAVGGWDNTDHNEAMTFQVVFSYDSEYKGYVADVPELPGCMSQGKTLDEAVENIRDAIRGYLHVLQKHGKPYVAHDGGTFVGEVAV
jgi:predicted RNase H-like HicB family nuclease